MLARLKSEGHAYDWAGCSHTVQGLPRQVREQKVMALGLYCGFCGWVEWKDVSKSKHSSPRGWLCTSPISELPYILPWTHINPKGYLQNNSADMQLKEGVQSPSCLLCVASKKPSWCWHGLSLAFNLSVENYPFPFKCLSFLLSVRAYCLCTGYTKRLLMIRMRMILAFSALIGKLKFTSPDELVGSSEGFDTA